MIPIDGQYNNGSSGQGKALDQNYRMPLEWDIVGTYPHAVTCPLHLTIIAIPPVNIIYDYGIIGVKVTFGAKGTSLCKVIIIEVFAASPTFLFAFRHD